jgi:hypothetical protein
VNDAYYKAGLIHYTGGSWTPTNKVPEVLGELKKFNGKYAIDHKDSDEKWTFIYRTDKQFC